jgi:transposase
MNPPDNSAKPRFAALIGLDWGDRQHALALREAGAATTETSTLDHSAENVRAWLQQIEQRFGGRPVALALETSTGPLIHLFFDVPWLTVYPIHPATSARIRQAFTPSGAKDDTPDAQVLLSLLVHHLDQLRPLLPEDALTRRLAALCQLRRQSVDQRTQVSNRLRAALKGYYPQALALVGETLHSPLALAFLRRWPDLIDLKAARPATIKAFYHRHNVRCPDAVTERLQCIKAAVALTTDETIVARGHREVARLLELLAVLQKHIRQDAQLIREALAEHPEAGLFRDLPGAGPMLAPRLLVAFGTDRSRYPSAGAMQRYSGVAPVKEKSGGRVWVHWRWNAPWFLRQTLIEWAGQTVLYCDWARAYYEAQKKRGKRHWAILRSLAFIWLRILWKCWQSRTPYQEATYLAALRRRGSKLVPSA